MDNLFQQALNVPKMIIPATQHAIDYINNSASGFAKGFTGEQGNSVGGNEAQQLGEAVAYGPGELGPAFHGVSSLAQEVLRALPAGVDLSHALPLALGLVKDDTGLKFRNALLNSGDKWASNNLLSDANRIKGQSISNDQFVQQLASQKKDPAVTQALDLVQGEKPNQLVPNVGNAGLYDTGVIDSTGRGSWAGVAEGLKPLGNTDKLVTVYRGLPKEKSAIRPGDYISRDPAVARKYGNKVVEIQIPEKHIKVASDLNNPNTDDKLIYFPESRVAQPTTLENTRNEFGLKDSSKTYREGGKLTQWTDDTGKPLEEAQKALQREQQANPNKIFVLKKVGSGDSGFYRIYENHVVEPTLSDAVSAQLKGKNGSK